MISEMYHMPEKGEVKNTGICFFSSLFFFSPLSRLSETTSIICNLFYYFFVTERNAIFGAYFQIDFKIIPEGLQNPGL